MSNTLPVSRVVSTTVNMTPAGAQSQSLSDLLVLGVSAVIDPVERYRTYASIADLAADFGTSAPEYLAAVAWFGQSPQPTQIIIGRWVDAASAGGLKCGPLSAAEQLMSAWTPIVAGKFGISIDGAAVEQVGPLDFSGAANLNAVAGIIEAALSSGTVVWNSVYSRFEFLSDTTGAASAISFLTAPLAGVDISANLAGLATSSGAYVFEGMVAESVTDAVAEFDDIAGQLWYGLVVPSADDDEHVLVAAYIEASGNRHIYGVTTQEAGVIVAATDDDIASVLSAAGYMRTVVQYSSSSAYAVCSLLGRILTTDYDGVNTVITVKFKDEPGVTAESLSTTQANAAEAKNANVFVNFDNSTAIIEQGVMCDGTFIDIVTGTDWLALAIQTSVYNLLYTSTTKIPQTGQGVQLLQTAIENECSQGVNNGLLAPGVWNATGFGQLKQGDYLDKGFYVYAQPIDQQNQATRAARRAPPFKVAAKLAGAIHFADIEVVVNQ
jgi:hypothetical protein